ncbi:hypothetical protein DPMN_178834 [Dreissena polymorpha]|uniref:HD domain-containing protein n=2 Tax=Dreissena polymorpha TaxID=45954 RepID=A0A9D4EG05_DREPO|nr:hypothetical protein DPMN_178834 [Dreissena polymorpha]
MKVLSKLTDDVFNVILNSTKPELRESREILRNVLSRELPKFVREKPLPGNYADDKESIEKIKQNMNIPRTEYIIQVANLDFGMKTENPINTQETDPINNQQADPINNQETNPINNQQADPINNQETSPIQKMLFYRKHIVDVAKTEETQLFPPVRYKEKLVRVFSTKKYPESCEHVDQKFCEAMEKMARERPADEGTGERSVERNQQEVIVPNIAVISDRGLVSQVHFKVFNDPVHGHISMHPLCVLIIDTPEFQRLRHIKQINAAYFVYPGASHNRFEHSLGVCYLAGRVVRKLKKQKQPNLDINDKDVLCVQIAGLCNDLGHGPFSYLFEHRFLPQMQPNCKWTHKEASVMMFSRLIEKNNLIDKFKLYGLENEDITFIKELLNVKAEEQDPEWKYTGRDESKRFLFEIVTNVRNGIDAETWDSCARDCLMLGMSSRFDHMRCIKYVRAIKIKNKYQICFRDKEKRDFDELFFILAKLKNMAYQHKTTFIAGEMIVEAVMKVNALILLKGTNRNDCTIVGAKGDMNAFFALTDDIITQILNYPFPKREELEDLRKTQEPNQQRLEVLREEEQTWSEARSILEKVLKRKFYKFVAEIKLPRLAKFQSILERTIAESGVEQNDIVCQFVELDYAPKVCKTVAFYSKHRPDFATVEQVRGSQSYLKETIVRVFCKEDRHFHLLKEKLDLRTDMMNTLQLSFADTALEQH